jgi:hypothetical protein
MAMVNSGPISLGGTATTSGLNQSVNVELGRSGTASINMNESAVRTLAGVPSGAISMSNFYGKSNRVTANITISADTSDYILNTAKVTGYSAGNTDVTLTINSGVTIVGSSTGGYAFTVNNSWAAGDTVRVINNGTILGRGGAGGRGGGNFNGYGSGVSGSTGGPALLAQFAVSITNNNRVSGGGGGGGGGGGNGACNFGCGGGGGGGIGNGSGSASSCNNGANPGNPGTLTAAGGGGGSLNCGGKFGSTGEGGNGGSFASSGSSGTNGTAGGRTGGAGGAGGACTQGGPTFITWTVAGTRNGALN